MDTADGPVTAGPEQLVARIQDLQARLESVGDAATREVADELVSAIVQMYGAGLQRILDLLGGAGDGGPARSPPRSPRMRSSARCCSSTTCTQWRSRTA